MLSNYLECRKNTESKKLQGQKTEKWSFYQNKQCVIVKNQNLSKSKKIVDF